MSKTLFAGLISLLCLTAGLGWLILENHDYETVRPERGTAIRAVYATGEVEPVRWAKISPQVAGQVISVWANDNDAVKAGDILAQLDDTVEAAKLVEYQSRLEFLKKEKQRYSTLARTNVASRRKLEEVESKYQEIAARIDAQAKFILRMQITAPLEGIVLRRDLEPGEMVTQNDVVFWVGKPDNLRVTAQVDEEDIPLVRAGQKALITSDAFPERAFEGTVGDVTPKGDPVDKDFRVRIALPEDTPLMIGMTAEVNIVTDEADNALLVPAASVLNGQVWVRKDRGFVPRSVATGIANERQVQILEGIAEQDEILKNPSEYEKK